MPRRSRSAWRTARRSCCSPTPSSRRSCARRSPRSGGRWTSSTSTTARGRGTAIPRTRLGAITYEALLREGDPAYRLARRGRRVGAARACSTPRARRATPRAWCTTIAARTSTRWATRSPSGCVPDSVYLWTLPMFHCNGWTYTWAVTAVGGTHVCLRRVDPALIFPAIAEHRVTHLCGAPIVLNLLIHAPRRGQAPLRPRRGGRDRRRRAAVGRDRGDGADGLSRDAPLRPHRVLRAGDAVRAAGRVDATCRWPSARRRWRGRACRCPRWRRSAWPTRRRAQPVPRDGATMGEVMLRGNTIMKGYLRNPAATQAAFEHGWYHTGDLAVWHAGRLHRDQGPQQGHHHHRRRERELARGRGVPLPPPAGDGGGGGRLPGQPLGRDAVRVRHAQGGRRRGDGRGDRRVVPRAHRALQGAAARRLRRRCPRPRPARSRRTCCASTRSAMPASALALPSRRARRPARAGDRRLQRPRPPFRGRCSPRTVPSWSPRRGARRSSRPCRRRPPRRGRGTAEAVAMDVRSADVGRRGAGARGGRVDLVVNNAGIAVTRPALETDDESWLRVIDTNLSAPSAWRGRRPSRWWRAVAAARS